MKNDTEELDSYLAKANKKLSGSKSLPGEQPTLKDVIQAIQIGALTDDEAYYKLDDFITSCVEEAVRKARIDELKEVGLNVSDWDNYCIKRYGELKALLAEQQKEKGDEE